MFPIGDDNSDITRTPVVTYVLLALNILVFVLFQRVGANDKFTYAWATVPLEIVSGRDLAETVVIREPGTNRPVGQIELEPTPVSVYLTLLTSMFMHGGIAHIFGNMLYLKIFGDNVEHALGRGRFAAFYLGTGLIASLTHVFSTFVFKGNPYIPSLGASGAISGVLGGYLLLFPHRKVRVIMLRIITQVPAIVAIGLWFVFQVISGLGALGGQGGGVAYGAHIGGFVAGLVLVKLFQPSVSAGPPRAAFR